MRERAASSPPRARRSSRRAAADARADGDLDAPGSIASLPGIGPARAARLAESGLSTLRQLLLCAPRAVRARSAPVPIAAALMRAGQAVGVRGRVESWRFSRFGRRSLLRVRIVDESGAIDALFFNQSWLRGEFPKDRELECEGRIVDARGPALAVSRLGSVERPLAPVGTLECEYAPPAGFSSEFLQGLARRAVESCAARLGEPLSADDLGRAAAMALPDAARELHAPTSLEGFERARRRAALEALLSLQARIAARRRARAANLAPRVDLGAQARAALEACLPFRMTTAQRTALDEIAADLSRGRAMRRLLQGDVGSGKTVVGALAALATVRAGFQAAFLAPTELLAEQHAASLAAVSARAGVRAELLVGSLPAAARARVEGDLASGALPFVFGTHALFSEGTRFARLGLAVIDEQQRFGVAQRARLLDKGERAHALLMTATPIPRSLALTLYGDLDVSVLRERPSGRGAVRTRWLVGNARRGLAKFLEQRLEAGGQAYWVVPRIDGQDGGAQGAEQRCARLRQSALARFGVELVHGRQAPEARARALERFRGGAARLLVATTVIEVGVDVPAATVMVIENAERLGLAQLHQLRGRVGRGPGESWCLLLGAASAGERLRTLEGCDDGFAIAEFDLARRGMGDLIGLRQAGPAGLAPIDLERDLDLCLLAREWIAERPELAALHGARAATDVVP